MIGLGLLLAIASKKPSGGGSPSGSPWGSHSYWRVLLLATDGNSPYGNAFAGQNAQFYDHTGGTNLAVGGVATSTQAYGGIPGPYDATHLFDGSTTNWSSVDTTSGQVVEYQFPAPVSVGAFGWQTRNDAYYHQAPTQFSIQFSDNGSTWTTAWSVTGAVWSQGEHQVFADPNYV